MPKFSFFNTSEFSVINWLIAFYFFCNTLTYLNFAGVYVTWAGTLIGLSVLYFVFLKRQVTFQELIFIQFFILMVLISSLANAKAAFGWGTILSLAANFGVALALVKNKLPNGWIYFFTSIWVIFVFALKSGVFKEIYQLGSDASLNTLSTYTQILFLTLFLLHYLRFGTIRLLHAIPYFVTEMLLTSRGGIVTSTLILFSVIWFNYGKAVKIYLRDLFRKGTLNLKLVAIFAFIAVTTLAIFLGTSCLGDDLVRLCLEGQPGVGNDVRLHLFLAREDFFSGRLIIYKLFFEKITLFSLFFGEDQTESFVNLIGLNGNTHNTFLGLWQLTGIWALFFGVLWCCGLVKTLYSDKLLFILMLSLTLRMLTEHFLLPLGFDFLVFMFLIMTMFSKIQPTHISIKHELPK